MFSTRFRRPLRPVLTASLALAVALAASAAARAAGVADYIPGDALMVVKINKLADVNKKAGQLATDFGLAAQNPEAADPLAAFKKDSGISKGINEQGDFALYFPNAHLEAFDNGGDGDKPAVVVVSLIPVSDYDAFVGNFQDVKDVGGGISSGTPAGGRGDTLYMMKMGDFAAVSDHQDVLKKPSEPIKFAGVTGERLDKRDAVVYANFKQLGPMLKAEMDKDGNKDKAKQDFLDGFKDNEAAAKYQPVAEAAFDQLWLAGQSFLRDADAAAITLNLSDPGIGFGVVAQFKPDSYLAKLLPSHKTTGDSMLTGLPTGTYLLYGGNVSDKAFNKKLFDDLLGPVMTKLKDVPDSKPLSEYVATAMDSLSVMGDARFGLYAPTGAFGQAPLLQEVVIQQGDAKQLMADQKKMADLMPQLSKAVADAGGGEAAAAMKTNYTADAKTVAGVSFSKFSTPIPEGGDMGPNPMTYLFGPEGPTYYTGEVDGKLLTVLGLTDQQIEAAVAGVKDDGDPLAKVRGVQLVSGQLPKERSAVLYFQPDELVRSGLNVGRQMGFNVPVQLPDDLPPVGLVAGPAENAIAVDGFVSKDLIQALVVAGLQVQQQMQGNGPGGGL